MAPIRLTRITAAVKKRSRQLRREMTDAERRLWKRLRQRQFNGYKFRRQHPLGPYVLDFVCLEAKLVVEADGGQHIERSDYDRRRTLWLEQKGYRVLRFWNDQILNSIDEVSAVIWQALISELQPPSPPSPFQGEGD